MISKHFFLFCSSLLSQILSNHVFISNRKNQRNQIDLLRKLYYKWKKNWAEPLPSLVDSEWTDEDTRNLLAWSIVPTLALPYFFCYLKKSSIFTWNYAKIVLLIRITRDKMFRYSVPMQDKICLWQISIQLTILDRMSNNVNLFSYFSRQIQMNWSFVKMLFHLRYSKWTMKHNSSSRIVATSTANPLLLPHLQKIFNTEVQFEKLFKVSFYTF
jgi:hypothetical protein